MTFEFSVSYDYDAHDGNQNFRKDDYLTEYFNQVIVDYDSPFLPKANEVFFLNSGDNRTLKLRVAHISKFYYDNGHVVIQYFIENLR